MYPAKRPLKKLGHNLAEDLTNFGGGQYPGLEILDFGGRANSLLNDNNAMQDRAFVWTFKNLGKPITDGVNEPGDAAWEPTYATAGTDGVFTIFGGKSIDDLLVSYRAGDANTVYFVGENAAGDEIHIEAKARNVKRAYQWFVDNPTKVVLTNVTFDKTLQKDGVFTLEPFNPFHQSRNSRELRFADHKDPRHFDQDIVLINDHYVIDGNMDITLTIVEECAMTVRLYCGAVANIGKGLQKAADKAAAVLQVRKGLGGKLIKRA